MADLAVKISSLIRKKDDKGLDLLYTHYADALFGIIIRITRNREVGEEILQETLLKVWNKFDQFDEEKSNLFTWMSVIARNTSIDKVRLKSFQHNRKTDSLDADVYIHENGYESSVHEDLDSKNILKNLDDKYKIIIDKIYFEGYSHSDLAEELNIPIGTIKTRLRKGIQILRDELKDERNLLIGLILSLLAMIIMLWQ